MKPLVPANVDLRDFKFMPLDLSKLFNSDTWALACRNPFAAAACINLWCRAWHEVPAGSLPNDDDILAVRSGAPDWPSVRDIAMRGFVLCDDGRLYHKILCEKVLDAWEEKKSYAAFCKTQKKKSRKGTAKRWGNKKKLDNAHGDTPAVPDGMPEPCPMGCPDDARSDALKGEGEGSKKEVSPPVGPPHCETAPKPETEGTKDARPKRATRLPTDWQPVAADRGFAANLGFTEPEIDGIADKFRDHWHAKPGKDAVRLDWSATWRNWCRREHGPAGGNHGGHGTARGGQRSGGVVAALREVRATRDREGVDGKPRIRF